MTGLEMCEAIAAQAKLRWEIDIRDPLRIWHASPNGELWHVFLLYQHLVDQKEWDGPDREVPVSNASLYWCRAFLRALTIHG